MIKSLLIIAGIFQLLLINELSGQADEAMNKEERDQSESIRIMFWNVENLFDPFDDSLTRDKEFTSQGIYRWTWSRFNRKLNNIYKVIISGGFELPDIIGLAEIENRWVLERLTRETPFSKFEYHIVHHDSPDVRGIDVALLYLPDSFRPIDTSFIPVTGLKSEDDPTRDILYVKGIIRSRDTVNVFVNHWPSRYPGQAETLHKRKAAAQALKRITDSLFNADSLCRIIIMGDFNDEPQGASISETLGAFVIMGQLSDYSSEIISFKANTLFCLAPTVQNQISGTLKFEGRWYLFDQFIVSGGLLLETGSYKLLSHKSVILDHDFLFEPDEAYTGRKPYRTYNGYIYKGGYSDHLPILLNLDFIK
jgi:Endonuclease/Exonuclease/phosphatase family